MTSVFFASSLSNIGQTLMIFALGSVCIAFWLAFAGFRHKNESYVQWAKYSSLTFSFVIFLAYTTLIIAFFTHDFSLSYVYRYSAKAMPKFYLFCAGWGGQDGSLLFWTCLMSILAAISLWHIEKKHPELFSPYIMVISVIQLFFAIVTFFAADVFGTLDWLPLDGKGLNPILQTPVMAIHPPNLYMGLLSFYVPYALGMAALIAKKEDNTWIRATRPWALVAWGFLTLGNLLGAFWAYNELGWGGFWAWDPVENASFLPWLTATAFLHSAMIQEKQGMLKVWNMSLLVITFFLTIFGTFLTRSGLISSIHAFARSDVSNYFVVFLIIILVFSIGLMFFRRSFLRSEQKLTSLISRESSFLINNALFSIATFIILLGTTYPLLREWYAGTKATVGPPFFNRALSPIAILFLSLLGVCMLLGWVKTEKERLLKMLLFPAILGVIAGVAFYFFPDFTEYGNPDMLTRIVAACIFGLCFFVLGSLFMEIREGVQKRLKQGEKGWIRTTITHLVKMRRRYGGYLVHVGVVFLFVGFAAYGFRLEKSAAMAKGESMDLGDYLVVFHGMKAEKDQQKKMFQANISLHNRIIAHRFPLLEGKTLQVPGTSYNITLQKQLQQGSPERMAAWLVSHKAKKTKQFSAQQSFSPGHSLQSSLFRIRNIQHIGGKLSATLEWLKPGKLIANMKPARFRYNKFPEPTTEVALKTRLKDDFYAVLATWEVRKKQVLAHFKFYLNPLLFWLWFGGYVMLLGLFVGGLPKYLWKPASGLLVIVGVGLFGLDMLTVLTGYHF